ncbi:NAD(P)-dependent oxidoreductase [Candidatus Atribacteria bacterium HGW-Atribacteria-1]|nr:MAG: NAD(P)-dependent oxidoreductase [Candidatus Atribacteria bacterium HGW-Atribacteria-1]
MNKKVVITGVLGGIGFAAADLFKKRGWYVIGIDRRENRNKNNVIDEFYNFDIALPKIANKYFKKISNLNKSIDCLINNVAIQICKPIQEITNREWDVSFDTNIKSIYISTKNLLDSLIIAKGSIVNVSSVHAFATSKNISSYVATKGGILSLTRALSLELSKYNIRVNAVLPGAVNTRMLRGGLKRNIKKGENLNNVLKEFEKKHPLGRIGEPEEIAKAIYFLADNNESSFITGQSLVVDGGAIAQLSTEV